MEFLPQAAGPHDPVVTTAPRPAGSIRRTSNIDTNRPDGLHADAVVDARARDLRTTADGRAEVVGEATLRATISATRQLVSIETSPDLPALHGLIGGSVGSGFRSRINEIATGADGEGSLLFLLLDDLTGATLVSGYAVHRAGGFDDVPSPDRAGAARVPDLSRQANVCAGWADDATMVVHVGRTGSIPVPLGPPAPVLEAGDDPDAWHAMPPLGPHGVRRRRRLDLLPPLAGESAHRIDLHFRDSHADEEGRETIMHEYTITGTVDPEAGRVLEVAARAQVLPWLECPGAVASAGRIAGMELSELRPRVRREFVGRSTCTHLNDSLRSLADTAALYRALEKA
jgi:hypothetical protein